jgi:predicted dehydrogenase
MDKWRYHPGVVELGRQIQSGRLGTLLGYQSFRLGWGNPHRDVDAIWILMPHDLSMVLHLIGRIPPLQSAAPLLSKHPEHGVSATFQADDSPTITITIGTAFPIARRSVVVVGDRGSAQLGDSYDETIEFRDGRAGDPDAAASVLEIPREMPLLLELKAFCEHVRGGPPPLSSVEDGMAIVEAVARVRSAVGL